MKIKGFQGTSLLDFPGRLAALVFTGGCNLACPYCHNPGLVLEPDQYPDYPLADLFDDLRSRAGFIDGIVISGGEPTLDPGLSDFLARLKEMELEVKLDTNGLRPDVLRPLLEKNQVDYLAIDLKTALDRYSELDSHPVDVAPLVDTIALTRTFDVATEFRTTCVPGLVEVDDIHAMGTAIKGADLWVLQQFVPDHSLDENLHEVSPHSAEVLQGFVRSAEGYVENLTLRGV
ncbi:MAG: anaerobic ribonucleoside-triphosphate reductase activating protein [Desulfuromonas sp.]|nr:MAG: anaerobic ribonucleoside-triphosphate reductase activating protein [Desulfuromonas sp.]